MKGESYICTNCGEQLSPFADDGKTRWNDMLFCSGGCRDAYRYEDYDVEYIWDGDSGTTQQAHMVPNSGKSSKRPDNPPSECKLDDCIESPTHYVVFEDPEEVLCYCSTHAGQMRAMDSAIDLGEL